VYLKAKEYVELDVGTGGPAWLFVVCMWPHSADTTLHSGSVQLAAQHKHAVHSSHPSLPPWIVACLAHPPTSCRPQLSPHPLQAPRWR
jgi:hypothetical protein